VSSSLWRLVSVVVIGVVLGLPGAVVAHEGGSFTAPAAVSAVPTIDGIVSAAEWADATSYDVVFGDLGNATVRFVHDSNDLYVGVVVKDPTLDISPSFGVFFDDNHDGEPGFGEDAWRASIGESSGEDLHISDSGSSHEPDTNHTDAAGTNDGDVMFELRHGLCEDSSFDMCVSEGETLGVTFQYRRNSDQFFNAPPADSNLFSPVDWADLVIAAAPEGDTEPPEVTVTAPKDGDVVSGTEVAVAANASDNTDVTAVEFSYYDNASETTYELGSVTDPPYAVTFDSTGVPNTDGQNGTVSATAYDAAGNQTTDSIGITVDNRPPANVESASISITGDLSSIPGAVSAAIRPNMIDAIRGDDDAPSAAPLGAIPLGAIPLGAIPLGAIPLGAIPLGAIGFTATNLDQNGLGGVPLSSIPLKSTEDTWQERLDGTDFAGSPVQSVTLGQVLGTPVVTTPTPVTLNDVDLAASPLGAIPLGAIALGGLPLGAIPLPPATQPSDYLAAWCAFINEQAAGHSCPNAASLSSQTMMGIALQGVPLGAIPLGAIPLGAIDLSGIPLGAIPLGAIGIAGSPLGAIPLGAIDLAANPLGAIPLGAISTPGDVVDCVTFDCTDATATLADAFAANAIKPDAKVEDIGYYCTPPGGGSCSSGETPILLEDFVANGLPDDVTLEDLLGTILSQAAYDWEELPIPGFPVQDFSVDGGVNDYSVDFRITGDEGRSAPATIAVRIPDGARYVLGSSSLSYDDGQLADPSLNKGNELVWELDSVPLNSDGDLNLSFEVKPGLKLRTETATAKITAGSVEPVQAQSTPASTRIVQPVPLSTCEIECGPPPPPSLQANTLRFGYTANGDDRDFFRLNLPEGTEPGALVTVYLSHLAVDDDLVVFGPVPDPLREPKQSTSSLQAGDVAADLQQRSQAIVPEVLGDVPVEVPDGSPVGTGVLGVSDNRGLADEEVTFIVPEDADGSMFIQITSFDGAYSNEPWMLRAEVSPAIDLPDTDCRTATTIGVGPTRALPTLSPTGSTLYLHNAGRYGALNGLANETNVWDKLTELANRNDAAKGTVVPIDSIPGVGALLTAWQGDPCSPDATNDVVRAIGAYLDDVPASYKYIVLVGDWSVIPPGLVLDNTLFANERTYASTFYGSEKNQYLTSYALGYLPTDDPYGDTSYSGQGAYIPEVAVGRLVESHTEIMGQLAQYLTRNGAIDPSTGLVTGYDFLSDGATAISNGLQANVTAPQELINETWTKDMLLAKLFPATNAPAIASVNAHYDHHRALPADQNAAGTEADLFKTSQVGDTSGRLVITIGCHSGTPVSDLLVAAGLAPDWDQTYSAKGAIGYIAQSTFGLGETAGVAYSEKLHALLAERLNGSLTVGQALVFAKQEYSAMPLHGGYDVKVIDGSGLYGLPMYRVGTGTLTPPPTPLPLVTDPATELKAATFNLSPTFTQVNASTGRYYTNGGNASFQNRRPIEPFTKLDVTQSGYVAHGALLTAAVSNDLLNIDAAFSRVVEDRTAFSRELVGDATSPTRLQSIATFSTPVGPQQRLVISTGQYLADGVPDAAGVGTQRLFSSLGGIVLYDVDTEEDFRPPTFGPVQAFAATPTTVGFAVDVDDSEGSDSVKRVLVLYKDGTGAWRSIDLSPAAGSNRWSGSGLFSGSAAEWFIQAVDEHGNVGVISNKASIDPVTLPAESDPPGAISAIVSVVSPGITVNGWHKGDVTVTISGAPGITSSLDGSPFTADSVVDVSGTGLHTVEYQSSNGARGTRIVPIDVTAPTIAVKDGVAEVEVGQAFAAAGLFTCGDAGSGIESCVASGINTSTPTLNGEIRTFTVTARDRVGQTMTNSTGKYRVLYAFRGFFQPVDNLPVLNSVKAGSAVPVKFSLGGNQGLNIFAAGSPQSGKIPCDAADPITDLESTLTAGGSSLSYSAGDGKYTYVWKTDKAWAGTCRQLIVRLADGTAHHASFKLK
jgi:hypothetical protein